MRRTSDITIRQIQILKNLYQTRNTYTTAKELDISQSKVARVLSKLRDDLDDRLLVRVGNELHTTEYFDSIFPQLLTFSETCETVFEGNKFQPENYAGVLRISLGRPILARYGLEIYTCLTNNLPNVKLTMDEWGDNTLKYISSGDVDIAIGYQQSTIDNIYQRFVVKDELFVLGTPDLLQGVEQELSLEQMYSLPIISWNPSDKNQVNEVLNVIKLGYGNEINVSLATDSLDIALQACKYSKGILISAEGLTEEKGLIRVELPSCIKEDQRLNSDITLYCHHSKNKSNLIKHVSDIVDAILTKSKSDLE